MSPLLAEALATALRAAELTDGAVDPTVGEAVRSAGYSVDFDSVARDGAPIPMTVRPVPGWRRIRLSSATRRVEIPLGVEVDLGATAKALAADLGAAAARDAIDGRGVLVSLGGDVAVAGMPPDEGWHVQIAEDSRASITPDGETIAIRSGGVATSSTAVRRWRRGGIELHHIIDPATGLPADGPWRTVSVVAGTCVDANIAATAAIVRGGSATAWLEMAELPRGWSTARAASCGWAGGRFLSVRRPERSAPAPRADSAACRRTHRGLRRSHHPGNTRRALRECPPRASSSGGGAAWRRP